MKSEIKDKLIKSVPEYVLDSLYENYTVNAVAKIRENYIPDDKETMDNLKDIVGLMALKEIKVEETFDFMKKLGFDDKEAKEIALIILCEIFYPISDFYPGLEDQIIKLGGKIPKFKPVVRDEQMMKREEEMEEMKKEEEKKEEEVFKDMIVNLPIKELVKQYPAVQIQQIGMQESIMIKNLDVPMKPLVKYWMEDYLEKAGYHEHSNLDRVQYVYHDKNTKNMNEEERRQLNLILKSVDEDIPLPYSTRTEKIDFSKIIEE